MKFPTKLITITLFAASVGYGLHALTHSLNGALWVGGLIGVFGLLMPSDGGSTSTSTKRALDSEFERHSDQLSRPMDEFDHYNHGALREDRYGDEFHSSHE